MRMHCCLLQFITAYNDDNEVTVVRWWSQFPCGHIVLSPSTPSRYKDFHKMIPYRCTVIHLLLSFLSQVTMLMHAEREIVMAHPSVCPSRSGIVSILMHVSSDFPPSGPSQKCPVLCRVGR